MIEHGIQDIFSAIHNVNRTERDETYLHGSKCIDAIFGTDGVMRIVEGIKLVDFDDHVKADHRGCVVDFDFEECFEEKFNAEMLR